MACQFRGKWAFGGSKGRTQSRSEGFAWSGIVLFIGSHGQPAGWFADGGVTELVAHYDIESLVGRRHS